MQNNSKSSSPNHSAWWVVHADRLCFVSTKPDAVRYEQTSPFWSNLSKGCCSEEAFTSKLCCQVPFREAFSWQPLHIIHACLFLFTLSQPVAFNMLTEARRNWDVALGFVLFVCLFFTAFLSIIWSDLGGNFAGKSTTVIIDALC